MVPSELKTVNHNTICIAIHITDKFSQQRTIQVPICLVQLSLTGASIIVCMFHTVTNKTLRDMLSTAVLCCIKNMFCIVLFVIRNLLMKFVVILEPSCDPPKHGGA
jgi:hypothetical protein